MSKDKCDYHHEQELSQQELAIAVTKLAGNLKWHTRIGYGVFLVGLAIIVLAFNVTFDAGIVAEKVTNNDKRIVEISKKVDNHIISKHAHGS